MVDRSALASLEASIIGERMGLMRAGRKAGGNDKDPRLGFPLCLEREAPANANRGFQAKGVIAGNDHRESRSTYAGAPPAFL